MSTPVGTHNSQRLALQVTECISAASAVTRRSGVLSASGEYYCVGDTWARAHQAVEMCELLLSGGRERSTIVEHLLATCCEHKLINASKRVQLGRCC